MANTLPIQRYNIEAYKDGLFLGYVQRIFNRGTSVICFIGQRKFGFNKKRAITIKRSAETAHITETEGKENYYNKRDNLTFEMVDEIDH